MAPTMNIPGMRGKTEGSIVVGDEVQIEVLRRLAVDPLEKAQPLDVGMVRLSSRDQFAFENAESGKQSYCAVARIIVRHGARMPGRERQPELRTLERLALALLIAAQHLSGLCPRQLCFGVHVWMPPKMQGVSWTA